MELLDSSHAQRSCVQVWSRRRHERDASMSDLSRLRPDAIVISLTPSLERSRRRRFMPATSSPRVVFVSCEIRVLAKQNSAQFFPVENNPLICPTVEQENGIVRLKTYEELSDKEKLQADYDLKDTNIVLQGLPPDVYSLVNHHKVAKEIWNRVKLLTQGTSLSKKERIKPMFKMVELLFNKFKEDKPNRRRDATWFKEKVLLVQAQAKGKELDEERLSFLADLGVADGQVPQTITHNAAFQTDDLDANNSDCDDISSAKAVLMSSLLSCDSDVLFEVTYSNIFQKDMMNQSVQELQYSEQSPIIDYPDNEITSDDLKAQIQEKVFANAVLKNKLRKLKGKNVINTAVSKPNATAITPGMFKLDLELLALKVLKNKDAHIDYIKHSREHADIL
nr:hypothetical protein [Tanacetum cinerariifolium]